MSPATAPAAAQARPPRAPRRSPSDLTFTLDEADVERFAANEPAWLGADRRAAFARYRDLPVGLLNNAGSDDVRLPNLVRVAGAPEPSVERTTRLLTHAT